MNKFYYQCFDCGKKYNRDEVRYLCPQCSKSYAPGQPLCGVLEAFFDYDYIKNNFSVKNPAWDLFSAVERKYYPEYPVGNTAFTKVSRLATEFGYNNLWVKFDGLNPSGSLKDRASFLMVAEANRLGEENIVAASTGNAASSLAAVAAAAGKRAVIFVPQSAPAAKLVQIMQYGAEITMVKGTYDDAFRLSLQYSQEQGGLNRNTAYHPLTLEGKKTVSLEIFAQNSFKAPDVVLVPVGDGAIISGVYKGFYDLKMADLIDKIPQLICVQAEKSNAIHNLIQSGVYHDAEDPTTVADSISVSVPSNPYLARRAVLESGGFSLLVSDDEILDAQLLLSSRTGIFAEPTAASVVAGLKKISAQNLLPKEAQIVLLVTGHGLKDIKSAQLKIS